MTSQEMYQTIQTILVEQKGEDILVSPDLSISDKIAEDSVEVMEFIISIEDAFEVEIPDRAIEDFVTLSDVVSYIENKKRS